MNTDDNILTQALEAHHAGDFDQAEPLYHQHIRTHPSDHYALDLLGILYAQHAHYHDAVQYFEAALHLAPDSANYENHLGNALKHLGALDEAISHFEKALTLQADYPEAFNNLANIYFQKQNFETAINYYQKAIDLKEDYADAYNNIATACLHLLRVNDAKRYFKKLLALQPDHLQANHQLGNIAYEDNEVEKAFAFYLKALSIHPHHVETHLNIGASYLKQEDPQTAINHFLTALSLEPENTTAHTNLAAVYFTQENFEEAAKHYYELLVCEPEDYTAHFNLGVILMRQSKWQSAAYHYKMALKINPNDPDAHNNVAATLLKLKQKDLAIIHYKTALQLQPDNDSIRYTLSALTGEDTPQEAPSEYVQALFDNYADKFDDELLKKLSYHAPELLYDAVTPLLKDKKDLVITDLGCGTGLCGEQFKPMALRLIGIDLSSKMIAIARKKKIYDQLIIDDLIHGMHTIGRGSDLMLAADVFVYIGDLSELFTSCYQHLSASSLLAFTLESTEADDFVLQASGRYAHNLAYVIKLAEETGFELVIKENAILRQQEDKPVEGLLFVLRKGNQ